MDILPNMGQFMGKGSDRGNTRRAIFQNDAVLLLFVDGKAIAVVEAKKEDNNLGAAVAAQAESYSANPQGWYKLWFPGQIPLVYLANGNKIYFSVRPRNNKF